MTKLIPFRNSRRRPVCRTGSVFTLLERPRFRPSLSDVADGSMCAGSNNGWQAAGIARPGKNRRHNIGRPRAFSMPVNQGVQPARISRWLCKQPLFTHTTSGH
jgi:hypothetical protein